MDSFLENNIYEETLRTLYEQERPSVLFRPKLMLDGNQYMALYGEDLMNGIGGFGDTADLAMRDFDKQWIESRAPTPARSPKGRTGSARQDDGRGARLPPETQE